MLRSATGLVAALFLVVATQAQDTPGLQRKIDGLSSPPSAEELATLGERDPNAYVYFLQDFLKGKGSYGGSVNGQLTNATISAVVGFCREAGFLETCVRGPLLPQSIAAVSKAVANAMTPVVETAAAAGPELETPAEPMPEAVAVAEAPVLPAGWKLNDNGGRGTLGLEVVLVSAGENEAVIHISGTAARKGYFNINVGPAVTSEAGRWVTQVSLARESAEGSAGSIWLRTARFSDKAYLGELFGGISISANADAATVSGTGEPTADTTRVLPYVQLSVEEGEMVDTTIHLADPSLVRAN